MNNTLLGIISWVTAGCILGFQGIKSLMNNAYGWHNITLWDLGNKYIQRLPDYVHFQTVHNGLRFFINDFPLYQILIIAGIFFFILDAFSRK